jgi:hypothetical protein
VYTYYSGQQNVVDERFCKGVSIVSLVGQSGQASDGGRVLDTSARLPSRGLLSQRPSVTCLRSGIARATCGYCVSIVFTWSKLLVLKSKCTTDVLKYGRRTSQARELVYKVFSYFKREADAICISISLILSLSAPPSFVHAGHVRCQQLRNEHWWWPMARNAFVLDNKLVVRKVFACSLCTK